MPVYQFIHEASGDVVEKLMSFSEHDRRVKDGRIRINGKTYDQIVTGGIMSRMGGGPIRLRSGANSTWPMKCDATGVNPSQIGEAVAHDRENGVKGVEYDPKTGQAIYSCRTVRKKHIESLGMYDKDGGYSDPQRKKADVEE